MNKSQLPLTARRLADSRTGFRRTGLLTAAVIALVWALVSAFSAAPVQAQSITVNNNQPLLVDEAGAAVPVDVTLQCGPTAPTASVTYSVAFAAVNPTIAGEPLGGLPGASLTPPTATPNPGETFSFDPGECGVTKTFNLDPGDDNITGPVTFRLMVTTISGDPAYDGLVANVQGANNGIVVTRVDTHGIVLSPISGRRTSENGDTVSFQVSLNDVFLNANNIPKQDVIVQFRSQNVAGGGADSNPEGLLSTEEQPILNDTQYVIFSASDPADFSSSKTVVVHGVDGPLFDGDQLYNVTIAQIISSDPEYQDVTFNGVGPGTGYAIINTDNEPSNNPGRVGITIVPTAGLITTEAGGTATFDVVLNTQPRFPVTLRLHSDDPTEGVLISNPLLLTFSTNTGVPGGWDVPQRVTVRGVDDHIIDGGATTGGVVYHIITDDAISSDPNYGGNPNTPGSAINPPDVTLINLDDDVANFAVQPPGGLLTTEDGGTDTFSVSLEAQPAAGSTVTLILTSNDTSEGLLAVGGGTPGPSVTLTFDSATFNTGQQVTVIGQDDNLRDGDIDYAITGIVDTTVATADVNFNGVTFQEVTVTNQDNEIPGALIDPVSGLTVTEAAGANHTATFTVRLTAPPTKNVTITLHSDDITEGKLINPVTGAESNSNLVVLTFTPTTDQPQTPPTTGTVSGWNVPQTLTVVGQDDDLDDGARVFHIIADPLNSGDAEFAGLKAKPSNLVTLTNLDDDTAGVTITPLTGLRTNEDQTAADNVATFTIVLNSKPSKGVHIKLTPVDFTTGAASNKEAKLINPATGKAISGPLTLTFTSTTDQAVVGTTGGYNVPQTVRIKGVDDFLADGNVRYRIKTEEIDAPATGDPQYAGIAIPDLTVINLDNDVPGITVTPTIVSPATGLVTTEDAADSRHTAKFTITLNSQPTAQVRFDVITADASEGRVLNGAGNPVTTAVPFTFTTASGQAFNAATGVGGWNVPHVVKVQGVDDSVEDGDVAYKVTIKKGVSTDSTYQKTPPPVSLVNLDDDDRTSPDITVDQPVDNVFYKVALGQATGTASDPVGLNGTASGIKEIRVVLKRIGNPSAGTTTGFLNKATNPTSSDFNTTFNAAQNEVLAKSVNPPDPGPINWGFNFGTALTPGKYQFYAIAIDAKNRRTESPTIHFAFDPNAPTVTVTSPANNASAVSITRAQGTASDDLTGVSAVFGQLFRFGTSTSPGLFFDGTDFTSTAPVDLPASGSPAAWVVNFPTLTPGKYFFRAKAVDGAGNAGFSDPRTVFTIKSSGGGGGGEQFDVINQVYRISVPFADSSDPNATTTPAKAFTVPPTASDGTINFELSKFDARTQTFVPLGNSSIIKRGEGYLLVPVSRGVSIRRPGDGKPNPRFATSVTEFSITLHRNPSLSPTDPDNGFNLIGFPFDPAKYTLADFRNSSVTTPDGRKFNSIAEAAAAGVVNNTLYDYDPFSGNFITTSDSLRPFGALAVRTFVDGAKLQLKVAQ